jgi:solute carrier family 27 fatty acid transporter 1/4
MFYYLAKLKKDDIILLTLPIYHTNGGVLGVGSVLINGLTIALRKKFSATNFFKDAIQFKCTVFIYIGEICRYLLNQPPSDLDKTHPIKRCVGNGLRENIHKEFSKRFGIKCIEIYGATEGNFGVSLSNHLYKILIYLILFS